MKHSIRLTRSALLLAASALILTSCHTDDVTITPSGQQPDRSAVHGLMAPLRSTPQTFTVTAGTSSRIIGAKGTVVRFYPSSFKNAAGATVTSGSVQVSLIEATRPGAMIANRATTASGSDLLQSGGEVYITATQNGQALSAGKYGLSFAQPAASSTPMNIYVGNRNNADSVVTWGTPVGTTAQSTRYDSSSGSFGYFYQFDSVSDFTWINCDYKFSSTAPRTDVTMTPPDTSFNNGNSMVWLVIPSLNAAMYAYGTTDKKFLAQQIPTGTVFKVFMVTNKNGNWYYTLTNDQTAVANHQLSLSPAAATLSQILTSLAAL